MNPEFEAPADPNRGSTGPSTPEGESRASEVETLAEPEGPTVHVVLFEPEIPPNTGNIGRTCVALGAKLWIVEPMGFELSDARIRRAGLDYWQHLELEVVPHWDGLLERLPTSPRMFFLSRFAKRSLWQAEFEPGDVLVFGKESAGLPADILDPDDPRSLRLPTRGVVRSLNLATTAGIVLYEHARQCRPT